MRTLAIGDIHGCATSLRALWNLVQPTEHDHIIFLGDYVDRGPDTKGVIDFLLEKKDAYNITFLSGNHEEKMFLARYNADELAQWIDVWDATATLDSYNAKTLEEIPATHWAFLENCKPYHETDTHIFVHANLDPQVPLTEQQPFVLIHKKFDHPAPHLSGKTMICGHTAQKNHRPLDIGHAICIDTDSGRNGWLTCLHIETGDYWQSNEAGESRSPII